MGKRGCNIFTDRLAPVRHWTGLKEFECCFGQQGGSLRRGIREAEIPIARLLVDGVPGIHKQYEVPYKSCSLFNYTIVPVAYKLRESA